MQTTITNPESMGLAAIHVVAGKMKITKRIEITETKWSKLIEQAGDDGLAFTFQLKKDGRNYGSPISLIMKADNSTRSGNYVELTSDWITNLPQGEYTIEETGMPSGFEFVSVSADTVVDADGDDGVNGTQFIAPTDGSVTWKIGKVSGGVPSSTTYSATDFSAGKVKDDTPEVDPDKAKAYLNAQIGKGIILNNPPKTIDVTLKKVDVKDLANNDAVLLKGAKFTITKYTNSSFNVVDTDTPWSSTLDDEKTGNTYSLNGTFDFKDLPVGYYKIDETRMPDGYVSLTEDPVFEVRVKAGTFDLEVVLYKKNGDTYEAVNSGTTEITRIATSDTLVIGNTPGAALPNTGGPGTNLIYLFGIMLSGFAGTGMLMKRRRRNTA